MSGKNRSISLNCSLTTPATMPTPTPNTPEILNAIINISSNHLEKMSANEIQLKTENTTENDLVEVQNAGQGMSSQKMFEDNNINRYHSQFIREGLKMKVKQNAPQDAPRMGPTQNTQWKSNASATQLHTPPTIDEKVLVQLF